MTLSRKITDIIKNILDVLLPPLCPVTQEKVDVPGLLSAQAWEQLEFIEAPYCHCCGVPMPFGTIAATDLQCAPCLGDPPPFDSMRSVWRYNDVSAGLIMRFKHGDQLHLIRSFTPVLQRALRDMPAHSSVVIPVPLHRWRLFKRLYNQAAILAQRLAVDSGGTLTYAPDILLRKKFTKSQGTMGTQERYDNMRGAFALNPKTKDGIKGKHVLIIDDVYTSGATIKACAQILKEKGKAARVDVITLARVVREY